MWQPGWEGSLRENGYMYLYMYGWVPLLSTWNYHNIVSDYMPIQNTMFKFFFFFFKEATWKCGAGGLLLPFRDRLWWKPESTGSLLNQVDSQLRKRAVGNGRVTFLPFLMTLVESGKWIEWPASCSSELQRWGISWTPWILRCIDRTQSLRWFFLPEGNQLTHYERGQEIHLL